MIEPRGHYIHQGHVLDVLRKLPETSVHCVVTSPPYWGLRDYGLPPQVWGGEAGCGHAWGEEARKTSSPQRDHGVGGGFGETRGIEPSRAGMAFVASLGAFCRCGAWRGSLGLEPTPELYVEHLVIVFREVRRVLRGDGTLWLNLGDSYNGHAGGRKGLSRPDIAPQRSGVNTPGLKPKDLVGIPWRVAFALQADGWYLRADIIWAKPNPMPESVRDRPTKAHEYVFLLSKSERYYYDAKAIAEPSIHAGRVVSYDGTQRNATEIGDVVNDRRTAPGASGPRDILVKPTRNRRSVWRCDPTTDVWDVSTKPYKGAHFATFPPDLVRPCVLAGCPTGGVVLDPFMGSGVVLAVGKELNREAWGIELKQEYIVMAEQRVAGVKL